MLNVLSLMCRKLICCAGLIVAAEIVLVIDRRQLVGLAQNRCHGRPAATERGHRRFIQREFEAAALRCRARTYGFSGSTTACSGVCAKK